MNVIYSEDICNSVYLGNFINTYIAYSNDEGIRLRASSGGVITELILRLFENKKVNRALLTRMDEIVPWQAKPYIAKTKDEVMHSLQSKYQPIQMSSIYNMIEEEKDYVYVDKFCGFQSEANGLREIMEKKRSRIIYNFGIFCGFEMGLEGTEFLLRKSGIGKNRIKKIYYRFGIWPGGFFVHSEDGKQFFIPKKDYSLLAFFCASQRCLSCCDQTNERADISFGDAWMMDLDQKGYTTVITRTQRGENLIREARRNRWITCREIDYAEIVESCYFLFRYKKVGGLVRSNFVHKSSLLDNLDMRLLPVKRSELILQVLLLFIQRHNRIFLFIFNLLPLKVFRIISRCIRQKAYTCAGSDRAIWS